MRLLSKFNRLYSEDPFRLTLKCIEWVIAVCTLVGGIYLFTPLYDISNAQNGATLFASTLSHPASITIWGLMLLVGAIMVIIGKSTQMPQIKSIGWFSIFLARSFQLLTTFLVQGLLPLSWIYPFTITVVVLILWALARVQVRQQRASP